MKAENLFINCLVNAGGYMEPGTIGLAIDDAGVVTPYDLPHDSFALSAYECGPIHGHGKLDDSSSVHLLMRGQTYAIVPRSNPTADLLLESAE